MSRILIVAPAPPGSRKGNRVTAERWAGLLRSLEHHVRIAETYDAQPCDVLIALHALKSAAAIRRFAAKDAAKPILLALTGTDLYRDVHSRPAARRSLELATRLVLLQPHGLGRLPDGLRAKARVIYQSAATPNKRPRPLSGVFEICVSGHLRAVKDPFRAAMAARRLPDESRIHVTHLGAALSPAMRRRAEKEMRRNPRYRWLGDVPRWTARRVLGRSRLLVLSSKLEGGANVISEALAASVPVLSSKISGSIGLLGDDHPGYFPVGDTRALAQLMLRCEQDRKFQQALKSHCRRRATLTNPERERAAWKKLLGEVLSCSRK